MDAQAELLQPEIRQILEEAVVGPLNLEKALPSFHQVVTCSALRLLRRLQKMGHLMDAGRFDEYAHLMGAGESDESGIDWRFYRSYAESGNLYDVRVCALGILVDLVHCFSAAAARQGGVGVPSDPTCAIAALDWLLSVLESDPEPRVRYLVVRQLYVAPPFARILLAPAPTKRGGLTSIDMVPTSPLDTDAVAERLCNLIK